MRLQTLEEVARQEVQTGGQHYVEFHRQFKRKGICEKLYLVLRTIPCYVFYTWFAPAAESYMYKGIISYLDRIKNGTTN